MLSNLTFDELGACPEPKRSQLATLVRQISFSTIESNDDTIALAEKFTVEDIHRLREYNHLRRSQMSAREVNEDTRKGAELFLQLVKNDPNTKDFAKV